MAEGCSGYLVDGQIPSHLCPPAFHHPDNRPPPNTSRSLDSVFPLLNSTFKDDSSCLVPVRHPNNDFSEWTNTAPSTGMPGDVQDVTCLHILPQSPRKKSWAERRARETAEERAIRLENNRRRMAFRRSNETNEERERRLATARIYAREKIIRETEEQREHRKRLNRIRTAIRRHGLETAAVKYTEDIIRTSIPAIGEQRVKEEVAEDLSDTKVETDSERERRLASAREYGQAKRMRETEEQREARRERNRLRMRERRKAKTLGLPQAGLGWNFFLSERKMIDIRLDTVASRIADKDATSEDPWEGELRKKIHELHFAPSQVAHLQEDEARSIYLTQHLAPLLTALEAHLSLRPDCIFPITGDQHNFVGFALYEELDSVVHLSPSCLIPFPTLSSFHRRFTSQLTFTTYALMRVSPPMFDSTPSPL